MKKLILSLTLALLSSGLFAQQVIQKSGMRILNLKRSTNNGNANTFEFKISDNVNGSNVIAKRSLSIVATQKAADIALLANPGLTKPQFLLKANGNVGIGTTNPENKLHVNGTLLTQRLLTKSGNLAITTGNYVDRWQDSPGDALTVFANPNFNGNVLTINSGHAVTDQIGLFHIKRQDNSQFYVRMDGNVGIGTTNPGSYKLAVNGIILAEQVRVTNNVPSSDYVFEADYPLPSLGQVEDYIKQHKHLPEVPSAKEFAKEGYLLNEMDDLLLRKVEELTLYVIEQQKEIKALREEVATLKQ